MAQCVCMGLYTCAGVHVLCTTLFGLVPAWADTSFYNATTVIRVTLRQWDCGGANFEVVPNCVSNNCLIATPCSSTYLQACPNLQEVWISFTIGVAICSFIVVTPQLFLDIYLTCSIVNAAYTFSYVHSHHSCSLADMTTH